MARTPPPHSKRADGAFTSAQDCGINGETSLTRRDYAGCASQRDAAGSLASRADAHYPGKTSALGSARRLAVEACAGPLVHQRGARASVGCRTDVFRARAPNGGRAVSAVAGV